MAPSSGPKVVVWDTTYACPLRCVHCYSESGRRPHRQLSPEDMVTVVDRIIELRPSLVDLTGGEPLLVNGITDIAARIRDAGSTPAIYTGGWPLRASMLPALARCGSRVIVSVDGPDAATHDRIRGRAGSFDRAMAALAMLDADGSIPFGIDSTVMRGNIDALPRFCTEIAPRFPRLRRISFKGVAPVGLASRMSFADAELLTDEQIAEFGSPEFAGRLRALAPGTVHIDVETNLGIRMLPSARDASGFETMFVEPDGDVRGMTVYEGTVGSLLREPGSVLWQRCMQRWDDPFVVEALSSVRTMRDWSVAARRIDYHFGSPEVRARIDARPEYLVTAGRG
jgi:MoaA/NifB/PqqE/SkfB family radical SAM enzyme